jgi:hypothetical protein
MRLALRLDLMRFGHGHTVAGINTSPYHIDEGHRFDMARVVFFTFATHPPAGRTIRLQRSGNVSKDVHAI